VRRIAVTGAALAVLIGTAPAAAARQMRADDRPRVSGAYATIDDSCSRQPVRTQRGTLVARSHVCLFLLEYDPLLELDPLSHHAAVWLQATLSPEPGWCTLRADAEIRVSSEGRVYGHTPEGSAVAERAQATTVELHSNADGFGLQEGAVAQDLTLLPGRWTTTATEQPEGTSVSTVFTGSQRAPLAFATGVAFAYPMLAPPVVQGGFSRFDFVRGAC
jgi:hypothetical protein